MLDPDSGLYAAVQSLKNASASPVDEDAVIEATTFILESITILELKDASKLCMQLCASGLCGIILRDTLWNNCFKPLGNHKLGSMGKPCRANAPL